MKTSHAFLLVLLAIIVTSATFTAKDAAAAGHLPLLPLARYKQQKNTATSASSNVIYYGGPVIGHVLVHTVYWGNGVDAETQANIANFYTAILKSNYLDTVKEYATNIPSATGGAGSNQQIEHGMVGKTITITPKNTATSITQADVEQELEYQLASGSLPAPTPDSLYMLHFPNGIKVSISFGESCESWLADHEAYKSAKFGYVFYSLFPCGAGDMVDFDTLTTAISHELAEAVTDPIAPLNNQPSQFPAAWLRADGQEIGDLCVSNSATLRAGTTDYTVQHLWLNSTSACDTNTFTTK